MAEILKLTEGSDYEKEIKVHDWMCRNVLYDYEGSDTGKPARMIAAHNIIGVFAHHRAQCEGIAKAVKVLREKSIAIIRATDISFLILLFPIVFLLMNNSFLSTPPNYALLKSTMFLLPP